jgi:hypothetical protein
MKNRFFSLIVVGLSFALPCALEAQSTRYFLEETSIQSGMTARFEAGQGEYCAAVVRGGAPSCIVLSPTIFSPPNRYLTLLSFGSFSHYDEGTYTSKGLTAEQARDLSSRRAPTIAANQESAIELQRDLSFIDTEKNSLVSITEIWLHPGSAPAFLKVLKEAALPAARKAKFASFEVYRTAAGGSPDRLFLLRHLRNFAELDAADSLRVAMSKAQQAEFDMVYSKSVASETVSIMRLRPDLSHMQP